MNFIKNGNYYIIAKYRDFEKPEIIPLKQNWYLEDGQDELIYGNDLAAIDLVTTKFSSIDGFKRKLSKEGLLKSDFVDLYIVHKHKYNSKDYLNETELLFDKRDYRTSLIRKMAKNRLMNIETSKKDEQLNEFYNRFFNKIKYRKSFKKFFTMPFRPNNEYMSEEILKEENPYKLKYSTNITNYIYTRNTANMWNLYDNLIKRYNDIDDDTLGDFIVSEYAYTLNLRNNRRIDEEEILKMIDKKQVIGQITLDDYFGGNEEPPEEDPPTKVPKIKSLSEQREEEIREYEEALKKLADDERRIRYEEEFDDPKLNALAKKLSIYEIVSHLTKVELRNLTPKDRLKLGFIGIVEYNNEMEKLNGKKRR